MPPMQLVVVVVPMILHMTMLISTRLLSPCRDYPLSSLLLFPLHMQVTGYQLHLARRQAVLSCHACHGHKLPCAAQCQQPHQASMVSSSLLPSVTKAPQHLPPASSHNNNCNNNTNVTTHSLIATPTKILTENDDNNNNNNNNTDENVGPVWFELAAHSMTKNHDNNNRLPTYGPSMTKSHNNNNRFELAAHGPSALHLQTWHGTPDPPLADAHPPEGRLKLAMKARPLEHQEHSPNPNLRGIYIYIYMYIYCFQRTYLYYLYIYYIYYI